LDRLLDLDLDFDFVSPDVRVLDVSDVDGSVLLASAAGAYTTPAPIAASRSTRNILGRYQGLLPHWTQVLADDRVLGCAPI